MGKVCYLKEVDKMLLINLGLVFVALIIIGVLIVILESLYRKNIKRIKLRRQRIEGYRRKVIRLESSDSDFDSFSKLVRIFFSEFYGLKKNLTYHELYGEFNKLKLKEEAALCKYLSKVLYSGDRPGIGSLKKQINVFKNILEKHS